MIYGYIGVSTVKQSKEGNSLEVHKPTFVKLYIYCQAYFIFMNLKNFV